MKTDSKPNRRSGYGLAPRAAAELRSMDRLVALFQTRRLPWELWSHRTQMIVGLRYVLKYGFEEGLRRIRQRVREYNAAVGIDNGSHETSTVYHMWALAQFRRRHAHVRSRYVLLQRLWKDPVSDDDFLARAYSREALSSVAARTRFLAPDRIVLPRDVVELLLRA